MAVDAAEELRTIVALIKSDAILLRPFGGSRQVQRLGTSADVLDRVAMRDMDLADGLAQASERAAAAAA
jgi:hypothetical protein